MAAELPTSVLSLTHSLGTRAVHCTSTALGRFRIRLRWLHSANAVAVHAGLLALDLAVIVYFTATTFIAEAAWMRGIDVLLGVLLAFELLCRTLAHPHPVRHLTNPAA